jgi:hypothetical protein
MLLVLRASFCAMVTRHKQSIVSSYLSDIAANMTRAVQFKRAQLAHARALTASNASLTPWYSLLS